jgi:hypothetical protein
MSTIPTLSREACLSFERDAARAAIGVENDA